MRKLLIALLLLIPSLGLADDRLAWHGGIVGGGVAAAPASCSEPNLIFAECRWGGSDEINTGGAALSPAQGVFTDSASPDATKFAKVSSDGWNSGSTALKFADDINVRYSRFALSPNPATLGVRIGFKIGTNGLNSGKYMMLGKARASDGSDAFKVYVDYDGTYLTVRLKNQTTDIGSFSTHLSTGVYYQVLVKFVKNTVGGLTAKLYDASGTQLGTELTNGAVTTQNYEAYDVYIGNVESQDAPGSITTYFDIVTFSNADYPCPRVP